MKTKTNDALMAAKYLIWKADMDGYPLQGCYHLLAVMFNIQQAFLRKKGYPLFHEDFEAWRFGPVLTSVYRMYCSAPTLPLTLYDNDASSCISRRDRRIVDRLLKKLEREEPYKLIRETRAEDSLWATVFDGGRGLYDPISKRMISGGDKWVL